MYGLIHSYVYALIHAYAYGLCTLMYKLIYIFIYMYQRKAHVRAFALKAPTSLDESAFWCVCACVCVCVRARACVRVFSI